VPPGADRAIRPGLGRPDRRADDAARPAAGDEPGQAPRPPPPADRSRHRPPALLTLADRLLATVLHQRLARPQVAVATLFSVRPETISKRIRDIRQLLEQAGYTIQPSPCRLASLDDLYGLAIAAGIAIPSQTKTAC
jgi:hypothetical protein